MCEKRHKYWVSVVEIPLTLDGKVVITLPVGSMRVSTEGTEGYAQVTPPSGHRHATADEIAEFEDRHAKAAVAYDAKIAAVPDLPSEFYALPASHEQFSSMGIKATLLPTGKYSVVTTGCDGLDSDSFEVDMLRYVLASGSMRFATEEESIRIQSRLDKETK